MPKGFFFGDHPVLPRWIIFENQSISLWTKSLWYQYLRQSSTLELMNKPFDPGRERPRWAPDPIPCEDCKILLDFEWFSPGRRPSVCRTCQNKRYEAKTQATPNGERRRRRRTLLAKLKRLEARIERDQATHAQVCEELKAIS